MLTIHATTPRPVPSTESGGTSPNDSAGFASMLRQSQGAQAALPPPRAEATPAKQAERPDEAAGTNPAEPEAEASSPPTLVERGRAGVRGKPRVAIDVSASRDTGRKTALPAQGDPKRSAEPADEDAPSDPQAAAAPPAAPTIDPGVLHWLTGLQRPAPNGVREAPAATAGATATTHDVPVGLAPSTRDAQPAPPSSTREGDSKPHVDDSAAVLTSATTASIEPIVPIEPIEPIVPKPAPAAIASRTDPIGQPSLAASIAPPVTVIRHEAPPPVSVALATPMAAAEFPRALGLQLSVFARDGVQRAELQLNPAEMGPVSVQIVMDGMQARVDFGADVAATRQAIEAGLPELASALRDAGFTLAGGGVSQHSQRRGGQGGDASSDPGERRALAADALAAGDEPTHVMRSRVRLGGLDLYA